MDEALRVGVSPRLNGIRPRQIESVVGLGYRFID
jgi:hypothetical protein